MIALIFAILRPVVMASRRRATSSRGALPRAPVTYIRNKDLIAQIRASRRANEITPELALTLLTLAQRMASAENWRGYSYREDMIAEAMPALCNAVFMFDLRRKNPHAYFYTAVLNAFRKHLLYEKRYERVKSVFILEEA